MSITLAQARHSGLGQNLLVSSSAATAWDPFGSIAITLRSLLFLTMMTACEKQLSSAENGYLPAQNASSARRKMWGEDGNDARFIKLD
jgi:hypothetical protein